MNALKATQVVLKGEGLNRRRDLYRLMTMLAGLLCSWAIASSSWSAGVKNAKSPSVLAAEKNRKDEAVIEPEPAATSTTAPLSAENLRVLTVSLSERYAVVQFDGEKIIPVHFGEPVSEAECSLLSRPLTCFRSARIAGAIV